MKASKILVLCILATSSVSFYAQKATATGDAAINSPLRMIKYMAVSARYGYGIAANTLTSNNNWSATTGTNHQAAIGWSYVYKNSFGIDAQFNFENNTFSYRNQGVVLKTGYNAFAGELGLKKMVLTKPDGTFFIRGAFGYNFGIKTPEAFSNIFYEYAGSSSRSSMYILPELGYQYRLGIHHIIDLSVFYHYGMSQLAQNTLMYKDPQNPSRNEVTTAQYNGKYFGAILKYNYLFWGSKKLTTMGRKAPQEKF